MLFRLIITRDDCLGKYCEALYRKKNILLLFITDNSNYNHVNQRTFQTDSKIIIAMSIFSRIVHTYKFVLYYDTLHVGSSTAFHVWNAKFIFNWKGLSYYHICIDTLIILYRTVIYSLTLFRRRNKQTHRYTNFYKTYGCCKSRQENRTYHFVFIFQPLKLSDLRRKFHTHLHTHTYTLPFGIVIIITETLVKVFYSSFIIIIIIIMIVMMVVMVV